MLACNMQLEADFKQLSPVSFHQRSNTCSLPSDHMGICLGSLAGKVKLVKPDQQHMA